MASPRQPSFAAGELAPMVWGRTDLTLRHVGLRLLQNFFVSHQGAAVSRPGTTYIAPSRDAVAVGKVRLIPFTYSDSQSYVLEFTATGIRFFSNGAQLESSPGVPLEVGTTYTSDELPQLKYVQSGDVLTLTHPNHVPRELKRLGHTSWTLTDVDFTRPTFPVPATCMVLKTPLPTADATHPAREWVWLVTELSTNAKGEVHESAPYKIIRDDTGALLPASVPVYPDKPVTIQLYPSGAGITGIRHRIYRGQGDTFGWIGDREGGDPLEFTDVGDEPDYLSPPPRGRNPFGIYNYATLPPTISSTEKPAVVGYFEDRRGFANTATRPGTLFLSATADYANFDEHFIQTDDDAIERELAARKREEIRGWLALDRLILFTNSSVWSFGGAGGAPVTPAGLPVAKRHIDVGSSWLDPLVLGSSALYVTAGGDGARDLFFDLQRNTFLGGDVSFIAQHLFENYSITDWCYAKRPWGLVWAVRSDGQLLSLTYDRDAGVHAWARHDTGRVDGSDKVEAVCSVPEADGDAVYVSVLRYTPNVSPPGRRYIERLAKRTKTVNAVTFAHLPAEDITLDSCVTYRGGPKVTVVTGLSHLDGRQVKAVVDGVPCGPFTVTGGQITIDIDGGGTLIHVGLPYTPQMELLDLASERTRYKNVTAVDFEVEASRGLEVAEAIDKKFSAWKQRTVGAGYGALTPVTDMVRVNVASSWNKSGRAALRQSEPLFVTVFGITREVEVGGS